jgi:hypothetical protein
MGQEDDLGAPHLVQLLPHLVGGRALAPLTAEVDDLAAVRARDGSPALSKVAVRDDQDGVARRAEVRHG